MYDHQLIVFILFIWSHISLFSYYLSKAYKQTLCWSHKTSSSVSSDPPDGSPACSILPVNNYTDLALSCSWKGGYPSPTLNWSPYVNGNNREDMTNITWIQPGPETANNSAFTCYGSHVALNAAQTCVTRTCEYGICFVSHWPART